MRRCSTYEKLWMQALTTGVSEESGKQLDRHLEQCSGCSSAFAEMQAALNAAAAPPPDLGPAYWAGYYDRLMTRMDQERQAVERPQVVTWRERITSILWRPAFAGHAVTAWVITAGFWIGYEAYQQRAVERVSPSTPSVSRADASVEARVDRYLDRTKMLFMALYNFDPGTDDIRMLSLPRQQAISRELLEEGSRLKAELEETDQIGMEFLIEDAEIVLLQLANLDMAGNLEGFERVQRSIDHKSLLMQISLEEIDRSSGKDLYQ